MAQLETRKVCRSSDNRALMVYRRLAGGVVVLYPPKDGSAESIKARYTLMVRETDPEIGILTGTWAGSKAVQAEICGGCEARCIINTVGLITPPATGHWAVLCAPREGKKRRCFELDAKRFSRDTADWEVQ